MFNERTFSLLLMKTGMFESIENKKIGIFDHLIHQKNIFNLGSKTGEF